MSQKLELTWVGKNDEIKIEPRLLIENKALSYKAEIDSLIPGENSNDNILIHGDNLLALKALEKDYAGQVKCIYIDPPYNTGSAFEHYDDNVEHSTWLDLMQKRLNLLKDLLAEDGMICVQIDAIEIAYLKIIMDEIFARKNFVNMVSVKAKVAGVSGSNIGKSLQDNIEYVLLYAKNINEFQLKVIPQKREELMKYIQSYADQGKSWKYTTILKSIDEGKYIGSFSAGNGDEIKLFEHENYVLCSVKQIADEEFNGNLKNAYYKYIDKIIRTTNAQTSIRQKVIENTKQFEGQGIFSIEYVPIKGKNAGKSIRSFYKGNNLIAWLKDVVDIDSDGIYKKDNIGNLWDDIQYNNLTKEGEVRFANGKKPEVLIKRLIEMTSDINDIILDSFLGSGTTAAVAHKMGRRWIGIEMGDHAYTHCKVRLDKVIDGEDQGGITKDVGWQGGGGYKFYELAPTLINTDAFGEPVINKGYSPDMLAAAVALHEGFDYKPSDTLFWKQSIGSENSFLFVTTTHVNGSYLDGIKATMRDDEYLVIACKSFDEGIDKAYKNIKIKKIPQILLSKCEFGKENYDLNIINPPQYEDEEDEYDE